MYNRVSLTQKGHTVATIKQKRAFSIFSENLRAGTPATFGEILIGAGYSIESSKRPTDVTKSKGWQELMEEALPDDLLAQTHNDLLKTTRIDHMVFPAFTGEPDDDEGKTTAGATLTDKDIREMLAEVGCKVRRIVHGESARHVYFWVADANAQLNALKLAYSIKGKIISGDRPQGGGNTYNTLIQQNNINPNAPKAKELVQKTLDMLMEQTKWETKPIDKP